MILTMKIERLTPSKHKQERILVFLEGVSDPLWITTSELLRFDLHAGMDLPEPLVVQLKKSAGASDAKARGAEMAGRQMLSKHDLKARLVKRGATQQDACDAADWLEELGAVDDPAFAALLARHYGTQGYGRKRVEQELYRRGIPRSLWEAAMAELPPADECIRAFLKKKIRTGDDKERKRLSDALLRRGFSWQEIRSVLRDLPEED
jgi:regulatory protein